MIAGDDGARLEAMLLTCGPATLAPLASTPGLIDEHLLSVSPAVVGAASQHFESVRTDLGLDRAAAKVFSGGAVLLRHRAGGAVMRDENRYEYEARSILAPDVAGSRAA